MIEPDARGYFGEFGGRFVPEVLVSPLRELEAAMSLAFADEGFWRDYHALLRDFVGRPTPLTELHKLDAGTSGGALLLKREDCNHTGAHKILNALGQGLLAVRMGKQRLIAETGAGQHGVATATVGALLGLPVEVFMGSVDAQRQAQNVYLMRLLGATVTEVTGGSRTLKDATNEAFRDWAATARSTFYVIGSAVGAHPYPRMVRQFVRTIGDEARAQCWERFGRLPDHVVACVGGGSNAIGTFAAFLDDRQVALWGVEAGGKGVDRSGQHSASLTAGTAGVLHGARTFILMDRDGQIESTHSVAAGLDYPGVGPEHAYLKSSGRARYLAVDDAEALDSFASLARSEGIVPALESAHAIAFARRLRKEMDRHGLVLVTCSGRGDKDAAALMVSPGSTETRQ
jgi:tryptophan synthase beta chain